MVFKLELLHIKEKNRVLLCSVVFLFVFRCVSGLDWIRRLESADYLPACPAQQSSLRHNRQVLAGQLI